MPRGGARPGAGRPKGSSKKRREVATQRPTTVEEAVAALPTKFDDAEQYLMSVINNPEVPRDDKIKAALGVIPYQKPKLADKPAGKKETAAGRAAAAAEGGSKFAPRPPPRVVVDNSK